MRAKAYVFLCNLSRAAFLLARAVGLAALILLTCPAATAQDFLQRGYQSTVVLYEPVGAELTSICTAFVFEKTAGGYLLLTASHCVVERDVQGSLVPQSTPLFAEIDGVPDKLPVSVLAIGQQFTGDDLAVLSISTGANLPVIPFGVTGLVRLGDELVNIAAPGDLGRVVYRCSLSTTKPQGISGVGFFAWPDAVLIQGPVGSGSSGSPVFSEAQQRIVGMVVGYTGQHSLVLGLVVLPTARIRAFVAAWVKNEKPIFVHPNPLP